MQGDIELVENGFKLDGEEETQKLSNGIKISDNFCWIRVISSIQTLGKLNDYIFDKE